MKRNHHPTAQGNTASMLPPTLGNRALPRRRKSLPMPLLPICHQTFSGGRNIMVTLVSKRFNALCYLLFLFRRRREIEHKNKEYACAGVRWKQAGELKWMAAGTANFMNTVPTRSRAEIAVDIRHRLSTRSSTPVMPTMMMELNPLSLGHHAFRSSMCPTGVENGASGRRKIRPWDRAPIFGRGE
jgi:hypothetical protein